MISQQTDIPREPEERCYEEGESRERQDFSDRWAGRVSVESIRGERGLLGWVGGRRFSGSWGRASGSRKRGLRQRDPEHRYGVGGWGACQMEDREGWWAEGNTTRHTQESRFVPSFLGKGPGVSMEEGRSGGETPCRTNEQQLPKSKMHVHPQKQKTKPFWNQSCRHQHL